MQDGQITLGQLIRNLLIYYGEFNKFSVDLEYEPNFTIIPVKI